jgi:pimeloyl-ACP methyl ester carboxylesterase
MFLAIKHPEMVESLVVSEPPIMKWLNDLPGGKPLYEDFMNNLWRPNAEAFRHHDPEAALRVTVDWFGSHEQPPGGQSFSYASLSEEDRKLQMQDIREWEAITTSTDAFPALTREQARHLRKPVLLLSGRQSVPALKLIAAELARTLPSVTFVVLPKATHEMWNEVPHELTEKIVPFLLHH